MYGVGWPVWEGSGCSLAWITWASPKRKGSEVGIGGADWVGFWKGQGARGGRNLLIDEAGSLDIRFAAPWGESRDRVRSDLETKLETKFTSLLFLKLGSL